MDTQYFKLGGILSASESRIMNMSHFIVIKFSALNRLAALEGNHFTEDLLFNRRWTPETLLAFAYWTAKRVLVFPFLNTAAAKLIGTNVFAHHWLY